MPRRQPRPPRSPKPERATSGSSARPGQMKRCSASTSGDMPASTPCRAATKPKAQNKAEPAPHATPSAVACLAVADGDCEESIAQSIVRRGFGGQHVIAYVSLRRPRRFAAKFHSHSGLTRLRPRRAILRQAAEKAAREGKGRNGAGEADRR